MMVPVPSGLTAPAPAVGWSLDCRSAVLDARYVLSGSTCKRSAAVAAARGISRALGNFHGGGEHPDGHSLASHAPAELP
jgi:hypothetical protein